MNKANVERRHNGVLFSHKEDENCVIFKKMDKIGNYHVKQNEPN
jgi:hypothetical protein